MNHPDGGDEAQPSEQQGPSQETSEQTNPVRWSHEPEILPDEEDSPHPHAEDTYKSTLQSSSDEHAGPQETESRRYDLRKRTVKKQYVYSIKTLQAPDYSYNTKKETVNNFRKKVVTKQQQEYAVNATKTIKAPFYDRETNYLECSDKDTFYALRRAWRLHFNHCETRPCTECDIWSRVRHEKWAPNEREYAECLIEIDKINVEKRTPTKIRFSEETVKVKIVKKYLPINVYTLSLATKFCTSLKEVLRIQHSP